MPMMQPPPGVENKPPQWPQMPMGGQGTLPLNPGQIGPNAGMQMQMGNMNTGMPPNMGMPPNFMMNNNMNMGNPNQGFVHPANVN